MVTHHPGVGDSLDWMTCFHELVPEPYVRVSVAYGSPTCPYSLLAMKKIGDLPRPDGKSGHHRDIEHCWIVLDGITISD